MTKKISLPTQRQLEQTVQDVINSKLSTEEKSQSILEIIHHLTGEPRKRQRMTALPCKMDLADIHKLDILSHIENRERTNYVRCVLKAEIEKRKEEWLPIFKRYYPEYGETIQ